MFSSMQLAREAREYISEFGIGESTRLKCDVYDGVNFLGKTMEQLELEESQWLERCKANAG